MVEALRRGALPPTIHVDEPSPRVDWSAGDVKLLTEVEEWPRGERARRAAVSSFGVSGTNAHVIVEEAPAAPEPERAELPVVPLVVSARDDIALRAQAERLAAHLAERPELSVTDAAFTLASGRAALEHRAAVVGGERDELVAGLAALGRGEPAGGVVEGQAGRGGKLAFVFPGQGSQWLGMALELSRAFPVFGDRLAECDAALSELVDWSLEDVLAGAEGAPSLERVDVVQPALFAVMVALAELWRSFGVEPAVVVGHSQGEIAAACVAGALTLDDAARVVALRSQAIAGLGGGGGMVSIQAAHDEVETLIERWGEHVSLAAFNGPASTVVSGTAQALDELVAHCDAEGVRARRIAVDYASHSPQIEALREPLLEALASIEPRAAKIPIFSSAAVEQLGGEELGRGVLVPQPARAGPLRAGDARAGRGRRAPVRRGQPASGAHARGGGDDRGGRRRHRVPRPGDAAARAARARAVRHGRSPRRTRAAPPSTGTCSSATRARGGSSCRRTRSSGAATGSSRPPRPMPRGSGQASADHPLLGASVALAGEERLVFTGRLSLRTHPWLADHAVFETVLLPGTAFVELALRAGAEVGADAVEELTLEAPLIIPAEGAVQIQVALAEPGRPGRRAIAIHSRPAPSADDDGPRASGRATRAASSARPPARSQSCPRRRGRRKAPRCSTRTTSTTAWPSRLRLRPGVPGPARGVAARRGDLRRGRARRAGGRAGRSLRAAPGAARRRAARRVPRAGGRGGDVAVRLERRAPRRDRRRDAAGPHRPAGESAISLDAVDEDGAPVVSVQSLVTRPVDPGQLAGARRRHDALFEVEWTRLGSASRDGEPPRVALLGGDGELAAALGADRHDDLDALDRAIDAGAEAPALVVVDARAEEQGDLAAARTTVRRGRSRSASAGAAAESLATARLVFLTSEAVAAGDGERPRSPTRRCGASSAPRTPSTRIASPWSTSIAARPPCRALAGALGVLAEEPQLALRDGELLAPRLARAEVEPEPEGAWHVEPARSGTLEELALAPSPRAAAPLRRARCASACGRRG
jgi:polyketide synthase 12